MFLNIEVMSSNLQPYNMYIYAKARPMLLLKLLSLGLGLIKLLAILPNASYMHTCSIMHWTHVIIFYAHIYMAGDWWVAKIVTCSCNLGPIKLITSMTIKDIAWKTMVKSHGRCNCCCDWVHNVSCIIFCDQCFLQLFQGDWTL